MLLHSSIIVAPTPVPAGAWTVVMKNDKNTGGVFLLSDDGVGLWMIVGGFVGDVVGLVVGDGVGAGVRSTDAIFRSGCRYISYCAIIRST